MAEAKLVLTDALIAEALRRSKRDRKAAREALERENETELSRGSRTQQPDGQRTVTDRLRPSGAGNAAAAQHEGD